MRCLIRKDEQRKAQVVTLVKTGREDCKLKCKVGGVEEKRSRGG